MSVLLRKWQENDARDLAAIINNKKILDNLREGIPYPYTEQDATEYVASLLAVDKNSVFAFAIEFDGRLAGNIGIFRQQNIHFRTAEMGYFVAEKLWNKGIITAAIEQACEFVFSNTDIVRIFAEPFARNPASCRALEKAGFTCEGLLRCNAEKNGILEDMKLYAKIKPNLMIIT